RPFAGSVAALAGSLERPGSSPFFRDVKVVSSDSMSSGPLISSKPTVWSRFGVEAAEERGAALMLAHSAFMGFGTVFFETAASALFLGRYGASALPSVYLAAAGLSAGTGYLYSRLQNR